MFNETHQKRENR